jgi:hypothetical protein
MSSPTPTDLRNGWSAVILWKSGVLASNLVTKVNGNDTSVFCLYSFYQEE